MKKAEKKFRSYAILAIFVLLTVLLAVINGVNFTMVSSDADALTQMLADRQGTFDRQTLPASDPGETTDVKKYKMGEMGPMGPDSPEMNASLRYFTIAFNKSTGESSTVAYHISAVTEEEATEWASGLLRSSTGWTRGTYRYRVYKKGDITYVTVIDQGRELLPSFRILIISAVGEVLVLLIGWFVLFAIVKKVYAPIEEADRKQKSFLKSVNREFARPLSVISGNTELAERKYGPDEQTRSTRRQISRMNELMDRLGTFGIFDGEESNAVDVPVSVFFYKALEREMENFKKRGITPEINIDKDVTVKADPEAVSRMIDELVGNTLKYSLRKAVFSLRREGGHVLLEITNDTLLPDGPVNEVFDRFTTLENAEDGSTGLGLAYVKGMVKALGGRRNAEVKDGMFILRITI
ncbi:MAG: HAMP domain-containing histidine kinase [Lachnospiraceae bacterium]|nr:HAMP domain-containing histidine kinase [Lachnospiraceae bacterium]